MPNSPYPQPSDLGFVISEPESWDLFNSLLSEGSVRAISWPSPGVRHLPTRCFRFRLAADADQRPHRVCLSNASVREPPRALQVRDRCHRRAETIPLCVDVSGRTTHRGNQQSHVRSTNRSASKVSPIPVTRARPPRRQNARSAPVPAPLSRSVQPAHRNTAAVSEDPPPSPATSRTLAGSASVHRRLRANRKNPKQFSKNL